jgi:hypothetical protein
VHSGKPSENPPIKKHRVVSERNQKSKGPAAEAGGLLEMTVGPVSNLGRKLTR